jgi:hypothetical protein
VPDLNRTFQARCENDHQNHIANPEDDLVEPDSIQCEDVVVFVQHD